MKVKGRVRLSDLRPISAAEFDTACHVCEQIKKIGELRASYIVEHGLDPDIALPGGEWDMDVGYARVKDFFGTSRFVLTPNYDVINRLRFYTDIFTGGSVMPFPPGYETRPMYPIPDNFDGIIEELSPTPNKFINRYIAITRYVPKEIVARPPKILGEVGWDIDGGPVNDDTCIYQERLNLLWETGIIDGLRKKIKANGSVNILEIGGGYGGLAYYLKHIIPQANYYICDIPESLLFSSLYLAISCPEYRHTIYDGTDKAVLCEDDFGFKFIPNFMFDDLVATNIRIDLALNTSSLSEMTEKQIRYYAHNLSYMLGDTGIFFEQNLDKRPDGRLYCKVYLPEYFKFRRTIEPKSFLGLTEATPDVWANREISGILSPVFKRQMLRLWLSDKIYRFLVKNQFAPLSQFINTRPRLKSFLFSILRLGR